MGLKNSVSFLLNEKQAYADFSDHFLFQNLIISPLYFFLYDFDRNLFSFYGKFYKNLIINLRLSNTSWNNLS
jgi:hypothetical protein